MFLNHFIVNITTFRKKMKFNQSSNVLLSSSWRIVFLILIINFFSPQKACSFSSAEHGMAINFEAEFSPSAVPFASINALLDIYNTLNGPFWNSNSNWGFGDPCVNNWYGITCNASNSSIIEVNLSDNGLSGILGEDNGFCNLPFLEELDLSMNNISGVLPNCLFSLSINTLDLSENMFSGTLPDSIVNVPTSIDLRIDNNQLTGCYINGLSPKCSGSSFSNSRISNGNNFDATWGDFCIDGDGVCCELNYEIDLSLVESGTYYAEDKITLTGNLDMSTSIVLKAAEVVFEPASSTLAGNIEVVNDGCVQN